MILDAKIGAGCRDWCWVLGMALGAEDGVGQGGACFANFLMGRCSRLPWQRFHLCLIYLPRLYVDGLGTFVLRSFGDAVGNLAPSGSVFFPGRLLHFLFFALYLTVH